ncbi:hypothetical protein [Halotalea alkalilenta]|uniref:hypothetical protein n=1 Tax=Halotalea alkalilenta TaxID=376489 RepID=UPI000480D932|nr:hypothetical protein [Halotalea alkalilenta]
MKKQFSVLLFSSLVAIAGTSTAVAQTSTTTAEGAQTAPPTEQQTQAPAGTPSQTGQNGMDGSTSQQPSGNLGEGGVNEGQPAQGGQGAATGTQGAADSNQQREMQPEDDNSIDSIKQKASDTYDSAKEKVQSLGN